MSRGFTSAAPTDSITYGDIAGLDSLTKLSVSLWVYIETFGTNVGQVVQKFHHGDSEGWALFVRNPAAAPHGAEFRLDGGLTSKGYFDAVLSEDTWYNLIGIYDGTASGNANRCKIYVNGSSQSLSFISTIPASLPASAQVLSLGKATAGDSGKLDGRIAHVGLWPGVILDSTEIAALAANGRPDDVRPSGLLFYAPLCADDVTDHGTGAATPTLENTTVEGEPSAGMCATPAGPPRILCRFTPGSPQYLGINTYIP